jgi:alpha-tubulin suppressor-like RCC1 family protein
VRKFWMILTFIFLFASCVKTGDESLVNERQETVEDVTISLLSISPPSKVMSPGDSFTFTAVGGNPPYEFSLESGGGSVTTSGTYTAPGSSGTATIKVIDAAKNSAFAVATITSTLGLTPLSLTIGTSDTSTFTGSGGVAPYTFSMVSGSGTIDPNTGLYTSPATTGTDVVRITDGAGSTVNATITIQDALAISPTTPLVEDLSNTVFSATGGVPPYTFSVYAGNGFINPTTGSFTAPITEGNTIIRVTDNNGVYVETTVTTKFGPNPSAERSTIPTGWNTAITSSEGTAPFTFAMNGGFGTVHPTLGVYYSPAAANTGTVRVTDANGFFADVTITTENRKQVAMSYYNTCINAIQNDNITSLTKCFGSKRYGAVAQSISVGDEASDMGDNLIAVRFPTGFTPEAVYTSYGNYNYCATSTDDRMTCWGYSYYGSNAYPGNVIQGTVYNQLGSGMRIGAFGTGVTLDPALPVRDRLDLGQLYGCAIVDDNGTPGRVKCFGDGQYGKTGLASQTDRCTAWSNCGSNLPFVNIGADVAKKISIGNVHTCVLFTNNELKCWGYNTYGNLGKGDVAHYGDGAGETPNLLGYIDFGTGRTVKDFDVGAHHNCAILDNDTLKCWGRNNYGQLGYEDTANRGDAGGEMGDSLPTVDLGTGVVPAKIYTQGHSSCIIDTLGRVKCWGYNGYGNLGVGLGQANQGDAAGEMGDNLPFIDLGTGETASELAVSTQSVCAILNSGGTKCWGRNDHGDIGIASSVNNIGTNLADMGDNLPEVQLGTGKTATMIAKGNQNSCALLNDNTVRCWGYDPNSYGILGREDLGLGDEPSETYAAIPTLDVGVGNNVANIWSGHASNAMFMKMSDGTLKTFGYSSYGNMAIGVGNAVHSGNTVDEIGNNLPVIPFPGGVTATKITSNNRHTCFLKDTGNVACFGRNNYGQCMRDNTGQYGDAPTETPDLITTDSNFGGLQVLDVGTGYEFSCVMLVGGIVKCLGRGNVGQTGQETTATRGHNATWSAVNTPAVNLGAGHTAKGISVGYLSACAILDDDRLKCWGYNLYGELGLEDTANRGDGAGEMGNNLPYVDLGTGRTVKKVTSGIYSRCAILDNDQVKCWGYNIYGQLGLGDGANRGTTADTMGDQLPYVNIGTNRKAIDIWAGAYSYCVLTDYNEVKCWGYNPWGNLGQGHRFNVGLDPLSMGDNLPSM